MIFSIIKLIFLLIAYITLGAITIEILKFHDRIVIKEPGGWINVWLSDDPQDKYYETIIAFLWPLFFGGFIVWLLCRAILRYITTIRKIVVAFVYTISVIMGRKDEDK